MPDHKFPWYSGAGDEGQTSLLGGSRVPKCHPQPEAYGTLDEANSFLGLARAFAIQGETKNILLSVQRELYRVMSELAAGQDVREQYRFVTANVIDALEAMIDAVGKRVEIPREFIVPGGTISSAALDVARTIVRRAERTVIRLRAEDLLDNPLVVTYLNRLSSLCFVLARFEESEQGIRSDPAKI